MSGIQIATIIVFALSLGTYGGVLAWKSPRTEWSFLLAALLLQIPMSLAVFDGVRVPLDHALKNLLPGNTAYQWLTVLYAPLTEEPAKLWPLLLPWFRRRITRENAVRVAVALGLGFGLGEVLLVARFVAADPKIATLPWHELTGFINERFMVCLTHGAFTATVLCGWKKWRHGFIIGVLGAMTLHLLGNLPILLARLGVFGAHKTIVDLILGLWVAVYWLAMLALLAFYATGGWKLGQFIFGDATCPTCACVYPRPVLALNLGAKRLERCPHCRKWHRL